MLFISFIFFEIIHIHNHSHHYYCFTISRLINICFLNGVGIKVSRNIDLVYGGGSIGLMGLVSQAVHDGGRHVIG